MAEYVREETGCDLLKNLYLYRVNNNTDADGLVKDTVVIC